MDDVDFFIPVCLQTQRALLKLGPNGCWGMSENMPGEWCYYAFYYTPEHHNLCYFFDEDAFAYCKDQMVCHRGCTVEEVELGDLSRDVPELQRQRHDLLMHAPPARVVPVASDVQVGTAICVRGSDGIMRPATNTVAILNTPSIRDEGIVRIFEVSDLSDVLAGMRSDEREQRCGVPWQGLKLLMSYGASIVDALARSKPGPSTLAFPMCPTNLWSAPPRPGTRRSSSRALAAAAPSRASSSSSSSFHPRSSPLPSSSSSSSSSASLSFRPRSSPLPSPSPRSSSSPAGLSDASPGTRHAAMWSTDTPPSSSGMKRELSSGSDSSGTLAKWGRYGRDVKPR